MLKYEMRITCYEKGLATLIGSPIAGAIYNFSGGYDLSFYVAGIT